MQLRIRGNTQRDNSRMALNVTGNLIVNRGMTAQQAVTLRDNSFVFGTAQIGALAAVGYNVLEQDVTLTEPNPLSVGGDMSVGGPNGITMGSGSQLSSAGGVLVTVPHGIVLGGQLEVSGDSVIQGAVDVQGAATIASLSSPNAVSFQAPLSISQNLTLEGSALTLLNSELWAASGLFAKVITLSTPGEIFAMSAADSGALVIVTSASSITVGLSSVPEIGSSIAVAYVPPSSTPSTSVRIYPPAGGNIVYLTDARTASGHATGSTGYLYCSQPAGVLRLEHLGSGKWVSQELSHGWDAVIP